MHRAKTQEAKPKVAVVRTSPATVLEDYRKLLHLAEYEKSLSPEQITALKINISWKYFYPGCSTTPWQLEGIIKTLLEDGYPRECLYGCHNRTVVVNARTGEVNNRQKQVLDTYGIQNVHLYEPGTDWIRYEPKGTMLVLDQIFPKGIMIPRRFIGENIFHLPTMKTHVFTTMTGAMKNAFGGLLHDKRHWTHSVIHETLVDLLVIQQEIHAGIFAVMDGTFAGDGPGPRCMVPHIKNYILASADSVALDTVAAHMMGFDPAEITCLRLAHERGLGCGIFEDIEIIGEDVRTVNFHFRGNVNTLASRGQKMIYYGVLQPLEKFLLRSPIVPWSYLASILYHDVYWYNMVGRRRVKQMLATDWGRLFLTY